MSKQPSITAAQHNFSQIPKADIQRSKFDRSHGLKTTFDAGYLIPIFVDEALPGDTFSMTATTFARLATPLHPVMDNMFLDVFWFSVPIRLLWDNWQRFNGEQVDPGDSTDYLVPQVAPGATEFVPGGMGDYFGLPTSVPDLTVSAFHFRAYNLIWNEWFRDQNLQDSLTINRGDGPDAITDYEIMRRGKRHDYFTSCLPWPQKGPEIHLTLGTNATIIPDLTTPGATNVPYWQTDSGSSDDGTLHVSSGALNRVNAELSTIAYPSDTMGNGDVIWGSQTGLLADLENAGGTAINVIRESFQIQRLFERDARGGSRYTEILQSHFGVTSPDARLQRPEYLGGGSQPVVINPVATTSEPAAGGKIGDLGGIGTSTKTGNGFTKSFTEHSVIIGLISARADLNYQHGINRMWSRETRWDYYWPALSHLGEQAVLNKEIWAEGTTVPDDDVFGYQERYAEYRYKPSMITGIMRSEHSQSLDSWHLAQDFSALPVLNGTFIEENPPIDRVSAVPSEPHFILDCFFKLNCARPMPTYSVPGMIDHF